MRAPTVWPLLRQMFPSPWLSGLGVVMCLAALGLLALAGRIPDADMPVFVLQGAALVAGGWWLLLGSPLCLLVCQMVPLRLPGIARTLRLGVLLHLVLSIGLPWLVLYRWLPAGVDATMLAAALWLGAATGLLIISMPMALPVVPLCIILADGAVVADPAWCGLLGAVALGLSALAWRWQLGRSRSALWAPAGVALGGSPLQLARLVQQLPVEHRRPGRDGQPVSAVRVAGRDLLAAFLGPSCQTLRQLYGRRGRWWVYLVFGGVSLALLGAAAFWPQQAAGGGVFLAAAMAGILSMVATKPVSRMVDWERQGLAGLAELQLVPGMPSAPHLPAAFMRQMVRCLGERLALVALTLGAAAGLAYAPRAGWLWWWAGLAGLCLVQGLASAWLALQARSRSRWWVGVTAIAAALAIFTNVHMLAYGRPLTAAWLLLWAGWMALAGMVFWGLARRAARGAEGLAGKPVY